MNRSATEYAFLALPALALALIVLHSSLWLPGASLPMTPAVVAGLVLVWAAGDRSVKAGAVAIAVLIILCVFLARPGVHLWGDGALRLRNLEAGLSVAASARFQPGDALIHRLAVAAGFDPLESFAVAGIAGGILYIAGAVLLIGSVQEGRHVKGALLALLATPAWMVFFTGYVESYALLAGLLALSAGLLAAHRPPLAVALCAAAGVFVHLLGVLMVPGALVYARERRNTAAVVVGLLALAGAAAWLLLTGGAGGIPGPGSLLVPGPVPRLGLLVFAAPAIPMLIPAVRERPAWPSLVSSLVWLAAFFLFPLEKGAAGDWDLGAVMLIPACFTLAAASAGRHRYLYAVTAAAVLLAGASTGSFLDPEVSLARFERSVEMSSDPAALEELAISRRDEGRYDEAADLFGRAFRLSGNGRHLSQRAEALLLAGRPEEALDPAARAVELRPDVETAWLQLVLVARDLDDSDLAVSTAREYEERFPDGPTLWYLALEACVPDGDPRDAWICAERALATGDTLVTGLVNAGTAAWMNGFSGLAMERYLAASDMDPSSPLPWYNMGMVMLRDGDRVSAVYYLNRALEVDDTFTPAAEVLDILE